MCINPNPWPTEKIQQKVNVKQNTVGLYSVFLFQNKLLYHG